MKIRTQFILSVLVFGILIVAMSASAIIIQQKVNKIVNQENIVGNVSQEANDLGYLGNNYMIYQESQQFGAWQNEYSLFSNNVTKLDGNTIEEKSLISNIQADVPQLKSVFDSVVSSLRNQSLNQGGTIDNTIFQISWSRMSVQNQELESDSSNLSHLFDTQANNTRQFSLIVLIILIALFGVYFLLNYLMIERRTLKSIAKLQAGTVAIGAGNMDFKIEEKENDEIGELSHSFNLMTTNLKTVTASKEDLEKEISGRKKAEESLRESETKYRMLFENMSEGFALCQMIYDADGKPIDYQFINVNPVMEKFINLPQDQIIGKTIRIIAPNVQSKAIDTFGRVASTGEQVHFENFSRDLNRWFDIYAYKFKPGQFGFVTLDIDDRKRAEDTVKTTLNRFYTILSKMPLGILLVTRDGQTEFANQTFCDMFHLSQSPEEVKNLTAREVIERIKDVYSNSEQAVARITEIVNIGEIVKDEEVPLQGGRVALRDFVPIWLGENRYGRLWIHRDITERKKIEDALKESEAKANALIKYAPTAIYELDYRIPRITSVNEAVSSMSGYTREELLSMNPMDLLDEDSKKRFAERMKCILAGEKIDETVDFRIKKKDGSFMYVTLNVSLSTEKQFTALVIAYDITERKRAEIEKSRLSQQRQLALDAAQMGWWQYDPATQVATYDEGYQRIFGISGTQRLNEEILKRLHPDDLPQVWASVEAALNPADPQPYSAEYRIFLDDGTVRWIEAHGVAVFEGEGVARLATSLIGTVVDITERVRADEMLKDSQKQLLDIIDGAPNSIFVKDLQGRFIVINAQLEKLLGKNREEVKGRTDYEIISRDRAANYQDNDRRIAENDKPEQLEEEADLADGRHHYFLANKFPLHDIHGKTYAVASISTDITEQKNAEVALQQTKDYLDNLLNYANAPIIVWDPLFRITQFNHAFEHLTGRTAGEVIGMNLDILFPEEQREHSMEHIRHAVAGERMETEEISIQRKDGSVRDVLWNSATLYDRDNNTQIATIAQGQDITARKKAEEGLSRRTKELEASNKELEAFSYSVSHDLRAPLRSITGFSAVLLEDYKDELDKEGKSYLKKISDAGELMGQLMDDLLKLSRVTRSDLNLEKLDITSMARKIVTDLAVDEPHRKVKVTIAPGMTARGDKNLLGLVLQNLLGNAWKYSSKTSEPRIEMGTIEHNGKQTYFVRDNGVGFDMTYANKLFQPFQRLHKATEFAGTGIGLATVQRIIRRHGGEVWAEAKVGEGATFYFTLN
jgi:PAS domain S-box-containing protein